MSNTKEYAQMTDDDLLAAARRLKRLQTFSTVFIGFLVGVMIYGVAKNGFGWLYILIPLLLIAGVYKYSQTQKKKLEAIQSEMDSRKGGA